MNSPTLLLCIGAQKAGTTWVSEQLKNHPNVFIPPIKELHHFDTLYRRTLHKARNNRIKLFKKRVARLSNKKIIDPHFKATTDWLYNYCVTSENDDSWYLSLFDFEKNQENGINIFVDNTPEYSILPIGAFKHMKRIHPNVKVLFIMREPASRTWSAMRYFSKNNPEKSVLDDVNKMITFSNEKSTKQRNNYPEIIENIYKVFNEEECLIDFYENIFVSEESQNNFLNKLCTFLSIDYKPEYFKNSISSKVNATKAVEIPKAVKDHLNSESIVIKEKIADMMPNIIPTDWQTKSNAL